jgi:hypothetical protein
MLNAEEQVAENTRGALIRRASHMDLMHTSA